MKNLTSLLILVLSVTLLNAQTDTTKIDFGKSKLLYITDKSEKDSIANSLDSLSVNDIEDIDENDEDDDDNKFNSHLAGFGIGINGFLNDSKGFEPNTADNYLTLNQSKSWGVSLNVLEANISIIKNYIGIGAGVGLELNNYRFSKNTILMNDSSKLYAITDTVTIYSKNKLFVPWVTVPLVLEFQIPTSQKRIHLAVGVVGALRIGGHTKMVYDYKGNDIIDKNEGEFHMNWFRYGLTGQIGYGDISLFANYSLSSLFKTNEGPELYPWNAGLKFCF